MEKILKASKCKYINYLRSSKLNLAGLKKVDCQNKQNVKQKEYVKND